MARAKLKVVNKKRKIRIEGLATIVFTIAICLYVGAKFGLKSYNYNLSIQANKVEEKANTLKEAVANLESDVNNLQNRDRVLGMVEKDGIKTNQDQVVVLGDGTKK